MLFKVYLHSQVDYFLFDFIRQYEFHQDYPFIFNRLINNVTFYKINL